MAAISIVIPAHNEEKYIPATLQSILKQSFGAYEILVIMNGCTDQTEAKIDEIKKALPEEKKERLRVYALAEAHVSKARNYGARLATGSLLLFLDADTQLRSNTFLEKVVEEFTSSTSVVGTTKVIPDAPGINYAVAMGLKNLYNGWGLYKGCSGALICRRDTFFQVQGYDERLRVREHRMLTLKLLEKGKYKYVNVPVITSMRRLQHWGLLKSCGFWVKQWLKKDKDLAQQQYESVR